MATTMPYALPALWRERANFLREFGDAGCARLWELAARELDESLAAHGEESLSLTEAAKLSGFTPDHLGQLVKRGKLRNVGREGAPRVRRADLPTKKAGGPGRPARAKSPAVDLEREHVRNIARSFATKWR